MWSDPTSTQMFQQVLDVFDHYILLIMNKVLKRSFIDEDN